MINDLIITNNKDIVTILIKSINTIRSMKLSMMAHPDCIEHSEFADYASIAEDLEDEILLIKNRLYTTSLSLEPLESFIKWKVTKKTRIFSDGKLLYDIGGENLLMNEVQLYDYYKKEVFNKIK